ncbi:MAG: di-trans,poly-cis-decaprenylcistransferase [Clostridia bacterium]|nr:di-trans,poly-cis-decaprenylcistransferase [Clostridia bacterium]
MAFLGFGKKQTEKTAEKKQPPVIDERLQHIAFIMDGNGRWAKRRGMIRSLGHAEGMKAFERLMDHCSDLGIRHVTVYAFSTENWKRPKQEVDALMNLLSSYVEREIREFGKHRSAYHFIGDKEGLPASLRERAEVLERMSADQPETLNIALNYGSHAEIVHAANALLREGVSEITEKALEGKLYTAHSPAPDLLIRTGGEYRLSNYLLWQLAYTELYFTDILWPDLTNDELDDIIREFYGRHRTYGGVTGEK